MTPPRREDAPLPPFDPAAMQRLLDGPQAAVRARVRGILSRPDFTLLPPEASIEQQRAAASRWLQLLADEKIGALALPHAYGGADDWPGFIAAFETIAQHDVSLAIKFTVHFGLWAACIQLLGNEDHARRYLPGAVDLSLPGCFALTEIGHGSNARELETTATYDPQTGEFILRSPTFAAGKNYIGNAARDGRLAAVFAQLSTQGQPRGVHAFVVPLRDGNGNVLPGVRIKDNGPKMGENGVDNARLWFDGVRVPRANLLDRLGRVAADGTYESDIGSAGGRFFATISALVGGRVAIAAAAVGAAKVGLLIAVRYARRRRQFRAPGAAEESRLIDYPTHQRRLLPLLANLYAVDFTLKHLVRRRAATSGGEKDPDATREVELLAAGVKAWASWNCTHTLQACREACGGEGYMSVNRLPGLKADTDIFTTFEGDNTVLMLWLGRNLLADAGRAAASEPVSPGGEPARWQQLFADRTRAMLEEVRAELAVLASAGVGAPEAASRQQNRLFRLAQAYLDRVLLEQFSAALAGVAEPALAAVLAALRDLFALGCLEQHRGWYLENGWLGAEESRALPSRVDGLCARLAPHAGALVDAFGLPAASIAAPIALPER